VVDRVEVRETHISWVFLAGDRAYKLKKPLVLPFVDYRTARRRGAMCREEVRLNRRLAPDVYLGVRAVVSGPDGLQLADEDAAHAVDYVVEMRRYDEIQTLAARLERGELGRGDVARVGRLLARFHGRADPARAGDRPAHAVERRITANLTELLAVVQQRAELEQTLGLERFFHAFVTAHAGLLNARARGGAIRDGHGDLRAEHVLLSRKLQIVDCLEFDRALREVDVAEDLAFLVMDLTALGGERFAQALVRAYRNAGGDPGDDRLIAFYAAHRALVRAKVSLLRAAQEPAASSAQGHQSAIARDLLALAERFCWRARLPLAIVVCGVPATGKTSLARALSRVAGLPHISSDVTRKQLAGVTSTKPAGPASYTERFSKLTYAKLGRRAAKEMTVHGGVVVDATFRHRADRDAFSEALGDDTPALFVECRAPVRVLADRARRRDDQPGEHVSDAMLAIVLRESAVWDPLDELRPEAHVTLRSDRPVDSQLADLRALLDRRIGLLGPPGQVAATDQACGNPPMCDDARSA